MKNGKHFLVFTFVLCALLAAAMLFTNQVLAEEITTPEGFVFDTATKTITGYTGAGGDIVIPASIDGVDVSVIGERAFRSCSLTSVIISEGIKEIENSAFFDNSINTLTFPSTLKSIGQDAFGRNALTHITLPNAIRYVGLSAFHDNAITSFTLPAISEAGFLGWYTDAGILQSNLTVTDMISGYIAVYEYTLQDEDVVVTNGIIESYQFCESGYAGGFHPLHVTIPSILDGQTVTGIGDGNIFWGQQFIYVSLPDTIKTLGAGALSNNYLQTIALPAGLETIGNSAFAINRLTSITLPNGLTKIDDYTFRMNGLSQVTIPESVNYIGTSAFIDNVLTSFELPVNADSKFASWLDNDNSAVYSGGATVTDITHGFTAVFEYTLTDDDVVVTDGVLKSWTYDSDVYPGSSAPVHITVPQVLDGQTVVELGETLFESDNIIHIDLPDTIRVIGNSAFYRCKLKQIDFPASLEIIDMEAFYGNRFENLVIPNGVKIVESRAFQFNNLKSLSLPGSLIEIGEDAFAGNGYLLTFQLPNCTNSNFVKWIDNNGQNYVNGETVSSSNHIYSAVIPYTITDADVVVTDGVITSYDYNGTGYIGGVEPSFIVIPDMLDGQTVTGIGDSAFQGKTLKGVSMADTITHIGEEAFYMNMLMYAELSNNVEYIDTKAFNYNRLWEIDLPDTLEYLGSEAFRKNNLNETSPIVLPSSLRYIASSAFSNNGTFAPITLPEINEPGFLYWINYYNYSAPVKKYAGDTFKGTVFAVFNYTLTDDDVTVTDGIITEYTHAGNTYQGGYHPVVFNIPNYLDSQKIIGIAGHAFVSKSLLSVTLPDTLCTIGERAFAYNHLNEITLPNSVIYIGDDAFWDSGINSFTLPSPTDARFSHWTNYMIETYNSGDVISVSSGHDVFDAVIYYTLTDDDVVVNNGVLESYAYSGSGYIENLVPSKIIIPDYLDGQTVTEIGENAFKAKSLQYVSVPDTVTKIGNSAFAENRLRLLDLSDNLTEIGDSAFFDNAIVRMTLPDTLRIIGNYAFKDGIHNNDPITIPNSIRYIGTDAFYETNVGENFVVPTITDSNFKYWADEKGNRYFGGETINLGTSYYSDAKEITAIYDYTLTNDDVTVVDGVITDFTYNGTGYEGVGEPRYFTIPNYLDGQTITEIGDRAFIDNLIYKVVFPDTLVVLGKNAFSINSLGHMDDYSMPQSIRRIEPSAYNSKYYDELMIVPTITDDNFKFWVTGNGHKFYGGEETSVGVASGFYAVYGYTLTDDDVRMHNGIIIEYEYNGSGYDGMGEPMYITIPDNLKGQVVERISRDVFRNKSLAKVDLPETLQVIHDYAFASNILDSITVPNSVIYIGYRAFYNTGIESFVLPTPDHTHFLYWLDENDGTTYSGGETITEMEHIYSAVFDIPVTGINIEQYKLQMDIGQTFKLTLYIYPSDATNKKVTYTSSNELVATVNAAGVVTGVAPGSATITATTEDGGFLDTCEVTIIEHVTGIEVPETITMHPWETIELSTTILPENADIKDVHYTSSNTDVASVDYTSGDITAKLVGTTVITAETVDGGFIDTCTVTVIPQPVTGVEFAKDTLRVTVGGQPIGMIATVQPFNAENKNVTYSSSDETIAAVDATGIIFPHKSGVVTITVTTEDGGFTDTYELTVYEDVTGVEVSPTSATMHIGDTLQLDAHVVPTTASNQTILYHSMDSGIARVSEKGLVTARLQGVVKIMVISEEKGYYTYCTITVYGPGIRSDRFNANIATGYLEDVPIGTTAAEIAESITNTTGTVRVLDEQGSMITGDVLVSTGYSVQLVDESGEIIDGIIIVISGDLNPDGVLDIIDYTLIRLHILDLKKLNGCGPTAADVNGDGIIDIIDYTLVRLHILGLQSLY